jgi:hypothetical protein
MARLPVQDAGDHLFHTSQYDGVGPQSAALPQAER